MIRGVVGPLSARPHPAFLGGCFAPPATAGRFDFAKGLASESLRSAQDYKGKRHRNAVDEQIEEEVDVLSFVFDKLGIKYAPPAK